MYFGGESGDMEMDNWVADADEAIWATEEEYSNWNAETKNTKSHPPHSLSRPSSSKSIGKMFYKTKLCSKFRSGVCPYVTNCNFAHSLQELRKPPPNWQQIVAAHEDTVEQHREEHHIPTITTTDSRNESHRSYKGRHCKKFYTEEGCPYGDTCTFLHDEQSRARESVAISVSPSPSPSPGPTHKPSNWKTRICNKWETTGSCPFGTKCHFAHGFTELHKFGGELMEGGGRDSSVPTETKQASTGAKAGDSSVATILMAPRPDFPSQRPSSVTQLVGQRPLQKWKGPDKISRIYGDWIDDFE